MLRTHFGEWLHLPVGDLGLPAFTEHCRSFSREKGAALGELARGLLGALIKFVNALQGTETALAIHQARHSGPHA